MRWVASPHPEPPHVVQMKRYANERTDETPARIRDEAGSVKPLASGGVCSRLARSGLLHHSFVKRYKAQCSSAQSLTQNPPKPLSPATTARPTLQRGHASQSPTKAAMSAARENHSMP